MRITPPKECQRHGLGKARVPGDLLLTWRKICGDPNFFRPGFTVNLKMKNYTTLLVKDGKVVSKNTKIRHNGVVRVAPDIKELKIIMKTDYYPKQAPDHHLDLFWKNKTLISPIKLILNDSSLLAASIHPHMSSDFVVKNKSFELKIKLKCFGVEGTARIFLEIPLKYFRSPRISMQKICKTDYYSKP